ncbi:MAG: 2-C-methyl-D-erythritol 2,4-cyclodiphosphate synthase [Thioalkalivibrionaceae bacterium]
MRIGQGFDVHAFGEVGDEADSDRASFVVLGGVRIAHERSLLAHSDGDVLLHAIADALLGAAALGDIGRHFPDTDPQYAGADSRALLRSVVSRVADAGWQVGNLDSTLIAQAPRMAPHIESMRKNLAEDLCVSIDAVSVKATTTERLGFTGRGEGIAAQAVVVLTPTCMDGVSGR